MKEKNQKNFSAKLRFASFKPNRSSKTQNKRNEVSHQNSFSVPFSFRRCLKIGNVTSGEGFFSSGKAGLTQEYLVYFKENRQSMTEKDPPPGRFDNFQTSPKKKEQNLAVGFMRRA